MFEGGFPPVWLEARALACRRQGQELFRDLHLQLGAGDILQIEGSNGAGKTSLLKLLVGLGQPEAGQVLWQGQSLPGSRALMALSLAYLGHRNALKAALTPLENLAWLLALAGSPVAESRQLAMLAALGLGAVLEQPCATLSAGQQRRVALARVLLSGRRLWVLDEPLTALDAQVVLQIMQALRDHAGQGGAIVLTAHQPLDLGPRHQRLVIGGRGD